VGAVFAFVAALVALRLAGRLAARWRSRRAPELGAWAAALGAYALAAAALAWGAAAGWDSRAFRVYYLFGALLTTPLLGAGSLLRFAPRMRAAITATALVYTGLAVGVTLAVPVHAVAREGVPSARHVLSFVPARILAVVGNSIGTLAVVGVALATLRARPFGNALILAGVACAALGSSLTPFGAAGTAAALALAAVLFYAGFVAPRSFPFAKGLLTPRRGTRLTR
jgi:hypothetical protein